jgi:CRISPR-associated protein Csm2
MDYGKNNKHDVQSIAPQIKFKPLDVNLFDDVAQKWVIHINKKKETKPAQMRNFYDYILNLYNKVDNGEEFNNILPFVKMLNSKVHYAEARKHVSKEFSEMIKKCVSQVDSKETLRTFKLFFEAIIGFSKK